MELSRRVFLVWMLLAAIASVDIAIPVLGECGHPKSPSSSSSHHSGGYYPPSSSKPPSSKSPCSTPKPSSPSPCSKSPSSSPQTKPPTTTSPNPPTTPSTNPPTTPSTTPPTTSSPGTPTTPTPYPPTTFPNTPTLPLLPGPPTTLPNIPGIPGFPFPNTPGSTPTTPSLGSPITGPCDYWLAHPELINQILGMFGSLGHSFSAPPFPSIFGGTPTVPQALQNTRTDGFGSLLRECAAALLNSVSGHQSGAFPFSTRQVQDSFLGALASDSAAAAQAEVFKAANEGRFH